MGWKDAPIANSAPKWAQAPAVSGLAKQEQPQVAVEQPKKQSFLGKIGQQWWETYVKPFAEFPQELKDYVQRAEEATIRRQQQKGGANIPVAALTETIQKLVGAPVNAAATIPLKIGMNLAGVAASNVPGYTKLAQKIDPSISAGIGKALEGYEKHVPGDIKNVVDISTVISSILPAGTVSKPIISSAGKVIPSTIRGTGNIVDKGATKYIEAVTGVDKEALKMASTKEGRTVLKGAAEERQKTISEFLDKFENPEAHIPEKAIVEDAVSNMPLISANNLISALSSKMVKPVGEGAKKANKTIQGFINDIEKVGTMKNPVYDPLTGRLISHEGFDISAADMLDIRRKIDNEAKTAFGKDEATYIEQAELAARNAIKNDLIEAAQKTGNTEYVGAMEAWADKLDKIDKLKKNLGFDKASREGRVESFVNNIFNKGKTIQRKRLQDVADIFGMDVMKPLEIARLADQLGPEGKARLLPSFTTGKANAGVNIANVVGGMVAGVAGLNPLAIGAGLAAQSPLLATRGILPTTNFIKSTLPDVLSTPLKIPTKMTSKVDAMKRFIGGKK